MRSDRPSRTAQMVTFGRALADAGLSHVSGFRDPAAPVFLNERGRRSLAKVRRRQQAGRQGLDGARMMADLIALRSAAIDSAVRDALAAGTTQVVLLGAGYDGRAWRMPELSGATLFEVDHPATQADKRRHLAGLPEAAATIVFVPVDFERDALDTALAHAGHDRTLPTCWIWEGVVIYLTRAAMRTTLAAVARCSAPRSTLIVNYHTARARRRLFARLIFRLIGEPHMSAWSPEAMASDLRAAGFTVIEDSGMADWNRRYAGGAAAVARAEYMRVAVGTRAER